jgi:Zn-dependent protease
MISPRRGSIRLFRFAGVDLFLHWSWFVVAVFEIEFRKGTYTSALWNVLEYLALFLIVLLHEFGHALACRQVGGTANQIMLWPLGGVAYVKPPQRPGATLWSIAAGPLVNVALLPVLLAATVMSRSLGWPGAMPNFSRLVDSILYINLSLLLFNLLPIYPLDGGQILRSLLWFGLGRARSLMAATILGLLGTAGLIGLGLWLHSIWLGAIAVYMLMTCWKGLQQAQQLIQFSKLPRREGFACPSCRTAPPLGIFWKCGQCKQAFDTFQTRAVCPHCAAQYSTTRCLDCGERRPMNDWMMGAPQGLNMSSAPLSAK